ncbi:N-acetylglucosamine kinase of eukaryotic type (plasmid) [Sinorhizobium alkalisoli]|nr:N-acetylglucosamine kinase of eukaryotic type [Sinorhizobium alkalisoli]
MARIVRRNLPFATAEIESDGLIALQGALGDKDGAVAILGTGTIYISRAQDVVHTIGGWGFNVGDLGSGSRIGHALLQECLLAQDGIHPPSPVTCSVLAEFDQDPRQIVEFAQTAKPGDYGRFAPRVFEHARDQDPTAITLLRQAAAAVDEVLDALVGRGMRQICLLGGLAPLYPTWLSERHRPRLCKPESDALSGAVAMAVHRFADLPERQP